MTLLKDNNYREINVALLSLEADIKNKITSFDTSVIDKQLVEINNRIDKINAGGNNTSAQINDIRYEIEDINTKIKNNSAKIEDIEQKLSEIFSAENKVTDFNTTKDSGIYYWLDDTANKPGANYGVLLVNKYDSGSTSIWVNQIAYGTNNKIYFRQNINSGSWTEWKAVAFEGEGKANFLDEYPGAGGTRLTSGNIVPKDASEYGGMRKDVVTSSMTDSGHPGQDGHLLTMFWDNDGRYDSQFFVSNDGNRPWVKVRYKTNGTDYGPWTDIITSNNIGSQTVANADTVDNYHASDLWRSDGAIWNPNANVTMTPSGNGSEWSFDFRDKNGATGTYWQVWDENKNTLLKVNADDGKVSAPYGFVGNLSGKADTAGTADKTVNDIDIGIPYVNESGQYVIPLGNIPQPGSGEVESPYNWDITGFFSIIRASGHAGVHITFAAGHGYSHGFTTYAYLDEDNFTDAGNMGMSIKAFQYNGKWWLGLWINTKWQGYGSKMTITFSRGLPATPTCILYNSVSNGVANKEIYDSIQDIPSWWWRRRTIYSPTTFTQNVTAPVMQANNRMVIPIGAPSSPLEDGCIWIER